MIHRFINNGYAIVLDVHSGAVHVVDPLTYEILGALGDTRDSLPAECPAEVLTVSSCSMLFMPS